MSGPSGRSLIAEKYPFFSGFKPGFYYLGERLRLERKQN